MGSAASAAEQIRPIFAEFASGPQVIDLRDISGRTQQEPNRKMWVFVVSPQVFAERIHIIGGESVSSHDGEVAGEVDKEPEHFTARCVGGEHADGGINGPGGPDDVGISLARVSELAAVSHEEAAVEADTGFVADAIPDFCVMERMESGVDRFGGSCGDELEVFRVGLGLKQLAIGPPP